MGWGEQQPGSGRWALGRASNGVQVELIDGPTADGEGFTVTVKVTSGVALDLAGLGPRLVDLFASMAVTG